jgi:hypothetical protein
MSESNRLSNNKFNKAATERECHASASYLEPGSVIEKIRACVACFAYESKHAVYRSVWQTNSSAYHVHRNMQGRGWLESNLLLANEGSVVVLNRCGKDYLQPRV